jgi:Mg2+/Co2+ transporter CorB
VDHLVGMVHVRDVLNLSLEGCLDKDSLLNAAEAPYFTPAGTHLNTQILNFQKEKKRSSFVVDEYGDLKGLITMEDILEEVVGEFTTNIAALSKDIIQEDDDSFLVDASITMRNLKRLLGWEFPELGPRTLSGVIIEYLGYIPPADCCLTIESYRIEILKVSDNMVKTVRIRQKS